MLMLIAALSAALAEGTAEPTNKTAKQPCKTLQTDVH